MFSSVMLTEANEAAAFCGSHKSNSDIRPPSAVILIRGSGMEWYVLGCHSDLELVRL